MEKKKILAISGSLRNPSFTEKMLDLCLEGMGDGFEVRKFYPHKMKINPCRGCWACWRKENTGVCVQRDDFSEILDVYKQADYFLIAVPLYFFGFPATVKNVIDRFFIILEPGQYRSPRGASEHPKRFGCHPKTALISSCGFPEVENFGLLRQHFRIICEELEWAHSGEILLPAAGTANIPMLLERKYDLIRKAGTELASGSISKAITESIAGAVMPADDYRQMCTANFQGGIAGNLKRIYFGIKAMARFALTGKNNSCNTVH